jgi:hypothetical protein
MPRRSLRPSRSLPTWRFALLVSGVWSALAFATGCSAPAAEPDAANRPSTADEADLKAAKPLSAKSFGAPLTKAALRASNDNLPDDLFETKWAASLAESPLMFFRAYPGAYHADLAQVAPASLPGAETVCFGDAHLENFGFLRLDGDTRFLYNDLDDAGYCAASVDAVRYFAAIRLAYDDDALTTDLVEAYVDGLKDASRRADIPASLAPDWSSVREKGLAKVVADDRFVPGGKDGLGPASEEIAAGVRATVAALPALAGAQILDVAVLDRTSGGSGGLARYWVLLNPSPGTSGPKKTIYELKETALPGTERGRSSEVFDADTRLDELKALLWYTDTDSDYVDVSLFGRTFLLRDRLAKKSVDLTELSNKDRRKVLEAQVGLLAARHAAAFDKVKKDDLRPWLLGSATTIARRWSDLFETSLETSP